MAQTTPLELLREENQMLPQLFLPGKQNHDKATKWRGPHREVEPVVTKCAAS
jgi:hypothetical protein